MNPTTVAHPFDLPLIREVAATPAEYARLLELAFPGQVSTRAQSFHVVGPEASMEIVWRMLPPRRIALLCLPRLEIEIRCVSVSAAAFRTMLAHMDRAMQRGGG